MSFIMKIIQFIICKLYITYPLYQQHFNKHKYTYVYVQAYIVEGYIALLSILLDAIHHEVSCSRYNPCLITRMQGEKGKISQWVLDINMEELRGKMPIYMRQGFNTRQYWPYQHVGRWPEMYKLPCFDALKQEEGP